jgi:hypothetical protein
MSGLYLLLPTLLVVSLSLLNERAGAILLMITGMDEKRARFQALSAFTRTGFTTKEAEMVMKDPRRRRIITWLIILGNAGLITVIVTATSSLVSATGYWLGINVAALLIGLVLVYIIARHTPLGNIWEKFVEKHIARSDLIEEAATEDLLHIMEGYGLQRVFITQDSPFIGQSLARVNTPENEFWIVGIERGKDWISLPRSGETIQPDDQLVVYGELSHLRKFFAGPS